MILVLLIAVVALGLSVYDAAVSPAAIVPRLIEGVSSDEAVPS